MDVRTLATTDPPATPAWDELARLLDRRGELAQRVDELERQQGAANEDAARASAAVAEAERTGEPADTKRLDAALAKARDRAGQPWAERRAGAQRALTDHDARVQGFTVQNYAALQAGLAEQGEAATRAVDHAAAELVRAHGEWQDVLGRMTALASSVRPTRPGDWTHSRSERVASEAAKVLDGGGELAPDVRDPRAPRHQEPADDDMATVLRA